MGTNLVPTLFKIFEKENSIGNPLDICEVISYIPLMREKVSEVVEVSFSCTSPLGARDPNKKELHGRYLELRVYVKNSPLLFFLMIMDKRKSSYICPRGKIGLIRLPVTQEIASSNLVEGALTARTSMSAIDGWVVFYTFGAVYK